MTAFSDQLNHLVSPYVSLTAEQLSALEAHLQLLNRWNAKMNLTAIRSAHDAVLRHYAECVWFAVELRRFAADTLGPNAPSVADVGSGAGFPGIPIAIVNPTWPVTLIESHQRKAVFLSEAARPLGNVRVLAERAEAVAERFDVAVSRAVDPAEVLRLVLAPTKALLVGAGDVPRGTSDRILPLPWGEKRVAMFHVEHSPK